MFGTLVAAFLGAWFAFKFQRDQSASEVQKKNMESANLSLSELASQHRQFTLLKAHIDSQNIDKAFMPYRLRGLNVAENLDRLRLEHGRLAFLLGHNPQILINLSDAQRDINTVVGVVLKRSDFHREIIQPAVEKVRNAVGTDQVPDNFPGLMAEELGFMRDTQIRALTDQTLSGIDHAINTSRGSFNELSTAVKQIYPGQKQVSLASA